MKLPHFSQNLSRHILQKKNIPKILRFCWRQHFSYTSNVISDEFADSVLRKDSTLVYKLEFFETHIETDPSKQQAAPKLRLSFNRSSLGKILKQGRTFYIVNNKLIFGSQCGKDQGNMPEDLNSLSFKLWKICGLMLLWRLRSCIFWLLLQFLESLRVSEFFWLTATTCFQDVIFSSVIIIFIIITIIILLLIIIIITSPVEFWFSISYYF